MAGHEGFRTLIVTAAIVTRGDRVLVAQRPGGLSSAGKWEFPGGKAEPGEDPRHALVRECREELAINVQVGAIYETIYTSNTERGILLLFYRTRILDGGEPKSMEANDFRWVTLDEMARLDLLEPDRPLVDMFRREFPGYR